MDDTTERVFETRCSPDGYWVFRRSDGTAIWRGSYEGSELPPEPPPKRLSELVRYNFSTTPNPPPTQGQVRANTADVHTITTFWVHRQDFDNRDIKFLFLSQAKTGSELYIQDLNDSSSFAMFKLMQFPEDAGDYIGLQVEFEYSNGVALEGSGILLGILT